MPSKPSVNYNTNQGFTLRLSRAWRFGLNFHSQNLSIRNALNATISFCGLKAVLAVISAPTSVASGFPLSPFPSRLACPQTASHVHRAHFWYMPNRIKATIGRAANPLCINWSTSTEGLSKARGEMPKWHPAMSLLACRKEPVSGTNTGTHPLCQSLKYSLPYQTPENKPMTWLTHPEEAALPPAHREASPALGESFLCSHRSRRTLADLRMERNTALPVCHPISQPWEHCFLIPAPVLFPPCKQTVPSWCNEIRKEMHYTGIFSFWFHSRGRISHGCSASPAFSCLLKQAKPTPRSTHCSLVLWACVNWRLRWTRAGKAEKEKDKMLAAHLQVCSWSISHLHHYPQGCIWEHQRSFFNPSVQLCLWLLLSFQLVSSSLPHSLFRWQ